REVLDALCSNTIQVLAPYVQKLSCSPSQAIQEIRKQRIAMETVYQEQGKELKRIEKEKQRRKDLARVQDVRNTKRHLDVKDHDAKARIDGFRVSGGDKVAGKLSRQLDSRMSGNLAAKSSLFNSLSEQRALDLT